MPCTYGRTSQHPWDVYISSLALSSSFWVSSTAALDSTLQVCYLRPQFWRNKADFQKGNNHLKILYGILVAAIALVFIGALGCQMFCRSRRKYKPEPEALQYPGFAAKGYSDFELSRQPTFGEQPPMPYEPPTPYSPTGPYSSNSPFTTTAPYTPLSAYTPITPRTWKKEDITNWPQAPFKDYD